MQFLFARILGFLLLSGACAPLIAAPVIFDTDIGTDIDDAYALAALLQRSDLEVLGVTTVSSDAVARARLAAKLLHVAGGKWAGDSGVRRHVDAHAIHEAGGMGRRVLVPEPARIGWCGLHAARD